MKVTYYLTTSAAIDRIPIQAGNMIFSQNEKKIYLDGTNGRVAYDSVITLATEYQRTRLTSLVEGFYFVEETKKIWRYKNGWTCLNPVAEDKVLFMPYAQFPAMGETGKLYVDGATMYVWDETTEDYITMSGGGESDWIDV